MKLTRTMREPPAIVNVVALSRLKVNDIYILQTISSVLPMAPTIVGESSWTDRDLTEEGRRLTAIAVKKDRVGWIAEIRAMWKNAQLTILIPPQIRQCVEQVAQNKFLDCIPRRNSGTRRKRRHRPHLRLLLRRLWHHFLPARRDLDRTEVGAGEPRWRCWQKPSIFAAIEKQWPEVEVHLGK